MCAARWPLGGCARRSRGSLICEPREAFGVEWAEGNGFVLDFAVSSDLADDPSVLDGYSLVVGAGHDVHGGVLVLRSPGEGAARREHVVELLAVGRPDDPVTHCDVVKVRA